MTFLELCQKTLQLANTELSKMAGQPLTVAGQSGDLYRLVESVSDAWLEIQARNTAWPFLWVGDGSIELVAGTEFYDAPIDCNMPTIGTMQALDAGNVVSNVKKIEFYEYRRFSIINRGANATPIYYAIAPDGRVGVYPKPEKAYTLAFDYHKLPQALSLDDDVPALAERYQMAIVYLALMKFGEQISRSDLVQVGLAEYNKILLRMSNDLLPDITITRGFF